MLTNAEIKRLKGLQDKKARRTEGLFVAETPKVCEVLLGVGKPLVREVYALGTWLEGKENLRLMEKCEIRQGKPIEVHLINTKELERISGLVTPQDVFMVLEIPAYLPSAGRGNAGETPALHTGCALILDDIRDPGNLGTILRVADWFGIDPIICTNECADAYQPKCVQSSMGSIGICDIHYMERTDIVRTIKENTQLNVFGTFLNGSNLYKTNLPQENAWYVIGNEARGIGEDLEAAINEAVAGGRGSRITIPPYLKKSGYLGAESLNAAVATAILCSEIRRK